MYSELITDDSSLTKVLLPEYVDYYSTAMLWLRIVNLKLKNSQPLTEEEDSLQGLTQSSSFIVPEPLNLQLRQLGNTVSLTRQHLYPTFPPLPVEILQGHGGYYGELLPPEEGGDVTIHNCYEEIPCLGVLSEASATHYPTHPLAYTSHL